MELSQIEFDDEFGVSQCDLSDEWRKAAEENVKESDNGNEEQIVALKSRLLTSGLELRPGDDHQLLEVLRAANHDLDHAVEIAQHFVDYQDYCSKVFLRQNSLIMLTFVLKALPSLAESMMRDHVDKFMVLPHRDKFGRRVIVYKMWDGVKYPYREIMNMFYVLCVALAREPKTQIAGITLIGDMKVMNLICTSNCESHCDSLQGMTRKHVPSNWADVTAWSNFMKVNKEISFWLR